MSYIVHSNFIYLAHPRTASIATERMLASTFSKSGGRKTSPHHLGIPQIQHSNLITGGELVFTTVRNPLDLIVSWWVIMPPRHYKSLLEFVYTFEHAQFMQLTNMPGEYRLFYFLHQCDCVLRFENLRSSLPKFVKNRLNAAPTPFRKCNVTKDKKPWWTYHTEETIEAMFMRFPRDMRFYYINNEEAVEDWRGQNAVQTDK